MKPRAKVVYTFLATLCCATILAIPAKRGQWKTITLSDGRQVKVELRGDERAHWWEDSIGNRYLSRGRTKDEGGRRNDLLSTAKNYGTLRLKLWQFPIESASNADSGNAILW